MLAPTDFSCFNTFSRIIFLDPILNMGYLTALQKETKSTVYLPHTISLNYGFLNKIDLSRNTFGKYFRLIQFACENKITGYYCYNLYKNILSKIRAREEYNYLQFFICLQVFKELGFIVTNDNDSEIVKLTDVKMPLNSSATYNRLNTMKVDQNN